MTTALDLVAETLAEIDALPHRNTAALRAVRRSLSAKLKSAPVAEVMAVGRALLQRGAGWLGWEVIAAHREAAASLDIEAIEQLGIGLASWGEVDAFASILAGPAWLSGRISDADVAHWAHSDDVWWRRAALAATTVLNIAARGGTGDTGRTLGIAAILAGDREDMVVKALSWSLRSLVSWDPEAVRRFLAVHDAILAARVKREVGHKLATGLKSGQRARAGGKW